MIDSLTQPPGGLRAGCRPFPEVWDLVEIPCGWGTIGQVCRGRGWCPERFCLHRMVKSGGLALPLCHWFCFPLSGPGTIHRSPHRHPHPTEAPTATLHPTHKPLALSCSTAHLSITQQSHSCLKNSRCCWERIKGTNIYNKILEECHLYPSWKYRPAFVV